MRVCIVYDCLYPYTIGGAERWYRNLAERLAAEGHDVTFLTLRQWERGEPSRIFPASASSPSGRGWRSTRAAGGGACSRRSSSARRACAISLRHGAALRRRPHRVLPVLLAARRRRGAARGGYRIVVDWHEVWTRGYWREYLGPARRPIGWAVQRAVPARAAARLLLLAAARAPLREQGLRGELDPPRRAVRRARRARKPRAGAAGRRLRGPPHSGEARSGARSGFALAREQIPSCAARSTATGPSARRCSEQIADLGLDGVVSRAGVRGRQDVLEQALATAPLPRPPFQPRGLRPRRRRGGGARRPRRRRRRAWTTQPPSSSRRASTERSLRHRARRARERDRPATSTGRGSATDGHVVPANADRLSLERSLETVLEAMRATERSVSPLLPSPRRRRRDVRGRSQRYARLSLQLESTPSPEPDANRSATSGAASSPLFGAHRRHDLLHVHGGGRRRTRVSRSSPLDHPS